MADSSFDESLVPRHVFAESGEGTCGKLTCSATVTSLLVLILKIRQTVGNILQDGVKSLGEVLGNNAQS